MARVRAQRPVGEELEAASAQPVISVSGVPTGLDRPRNLIAAQVLRDPDVLPIRFAQIVPAQRRGDAVEIVDAGQSLGQEQLLRAVEAFDLFLARGLGDEPGHQVGGVLADEPGQLTVLVADELSAPGVGRECVDAGDLEGMGIRPKRVEVE